MDFLSLAEKRYSARSFSDKQVAPELVDKILAAGRLAPTAANFQPQKILVLDSQEGIQALGKVNGHVRSFRPPLCFVICYDKLISGKRPYDNHDYGVTDASIVATHMTLEAADLGLGSTWVGHFPPEDVKKALNLPESWVPVVILPTGYPDEAGKPHANHFSRREQSETVYFNTVSTEA